MTPLAIALGLVGLGAVAAIWDSWRRAIASQVELTRLRVEGLRREETAALAARVVTLEGEVASLTSAVAFGRKR